MYNYNYNSAPTSLGIPEKWERVLCYVFGWISGLILLLVEQRNQTVRRHAMQSVVVFGVLGIIGFALLVLGGMFGIIPVIGPALAGVIGVVGGVVKLVSFVAWIALMFLAYFNSKTFITGPRYERYM